MNVYSELWDLLAPVEVQQSPVCFGTLTALDPMEVTVGETAVSRGLLWDRDRVWKETDIGAELALLPWTGGLLVLFPVKGGDA